MKAQRGTHVINQKHEHGKQEEAEDTGSCDGPSFEEAELEHLALGTKEHLPCDEHKRQHPRENEHGDNTAVIPLSRDAAILEGKNEADCPAHGHDGTDPVAPQELVQHLPAVALVRVVAAERGTIGLEDKNAG